MKYDIYGTRNELDQFGIEICPPLDDLAINGIRDALLHAGPSLKPDAAFVAITRKDHNGTAIVMETPHNRHPHLPSILDRIARLIDPCNLHQTNTHIIKTV